MEHFLQPEQLKILKCYLEHCTGESRIYYKTLSVDRKPKFSWESDQSEKPEMFATTPRRKLGFYWNALVYGTTLTGCFLSRFLFHANGASVISAPSLLAFSVFPVQVCILASVFRDFVLTYLLMPSQFVGKLMAAEHEQDAAERFEKSFPIPTKDGQVVDAIEITQHGIQSRCQSNFI